ncbi:hypothetical protein SAMN05192558_104411 [Actinokineospora alba]|uniref:PBP domain-containing protein n=1 Tax=Actinokineospora alba TaxID=504798 RepID=A0A1H0M4A9_9PSEU|nr:hypothetical protein [Actinokineospora alba]TDP67582.1 hypothetical protein C8E96_3128 [Actinokineospora alba]SDI45052.1 hypothetical protein SAMN05421871_10549 [Actinokineospora alba]SDO75298.1 hypothetical protein SAMN05192558_104411 [Actinokineospora alba]
MSLIRLVLATVMVVSGVVIAQPATADPTELATPSQVTVRGAKRFKDLEITVSQTADLINQTIRVSWKGAKPTDPGRGKNYLQIMQCWGDDPAGPRREQCQYGTPLGTYDSSAMWSRALLYGDLHHDPLETQKQEAKGTTYVPFQPVSGEPTKPTEQGHGEYFDASTTNEVQLAATREDGTGEVDFEVLTATEAYGLGCGKPLPTGKPRHCWLVVVPRDDIETNGKVVGADYFHNFLDSSPLSRSNFANAIPVPLRFLPVGEACGLGRAERPLTGHEFIADAVQRWQPAMCAGDGPVFGFAQVSDRQARDQLASPDPGLVFASKPADPATLTSAAPVVYAPMAVSGFGLGFIMERQAAPGSPPEIAVRDGRPITELKLTPRLVAKLLTQSYQDSVPGVPEYLADNPTRLRVDKEFLEHNPEFVTYGFLMQTVDILAPSIDQDVTAALWAWINSDKEAREFLDGKPDPYGMVVNKNYLKLALPVENFPKADLSCVTREFNGVKAPLCAQTLRPLAADMHEAGRAVSRGDSLGRTPSGLADPNDPTLPGFQKVGRLPVGRRAQIAAVDTVTAKRYGLLVAKLRNAAGEFVEPTDASLLAGVREMVPSGVPGVVATNPLSKSPNAYPLTNLTYAATVPSTLDAAAGRDYAELIRFATGAGQQVGDGAGRLPRGHLPLPGVLRDQALAAADVIERDAGKPVGTQAAEPAAEPGEAAPPQAAAAAPQPAPAAPAPAPAPVQSTVESRPVAESRSTPSLPVGWVLRYLLAGILVAGGLATGAYPLLLRLGARARE